MSLLQLLLLTAEDMANALGDLIGATRTASGKSVQDPAMDKLKTSPKVGLIKIKVCFIWKQVDINWNPCFP